MRESANSRSAEGTAALDKALDVLDAIGSSKNGLAQAELAAQLRLPRTTLYRLLGTLVARGLLRRDPMRRVYCLGFRCFEYARAAYSMPDLVAAAGVELRALRDISGETTYLAALDGLEMISLDRCDGAHSHRSNSAYGQRKPVHCTSQGKAVLAALPPDKRDPLVRELRLEALTPRTITDRRRLQADLKATAQRGWSIDDEEIVVGVRCCGAAIVDARGDVRGAISVAGPAFRLTLERLELLGPEVAEAARRIGAQLAAAVPARDGDDDEVGVVPGDWAFEGAFPLWSPAADRLLWADTLAPALHAATTAGDAIVATFAEPISAVLERGGAAAVQSGDGWRAFAPDGRAAEAPDLRELPNRRFSAICVGPRGRPWACMPDGERWRVAELTADGSAMGGVRLQEPATALAFDEAGRTLHIAAAASGTIWASQVGAGNGAPGPHGVLRRLATVPKGSGRLAGLAVDGRGGIWTALRGGWSVARFEPDGSMDRVIALPVPLPSGVAFGHDGANGNAGGTLFVTSARETLDREALEAAPLSGRLFSVAMEP